LIDLGFGSAETLKMNLAFAVQELG
jgi:hypothetical protein